MDHHPLLLGIFMRYVTAEHEFNFGVWFVPTAVVSSWGSFLALATSSSGLSGGDMVTKI